MLNNKQKRRLHDTVVVRGRREIRRKIKTGDYMKEKREEYGIMNVHEFVADEEFLQDMIADIENDRARRIVYDKDYQRIDLDNWYAMRARKERNKKIKERIAAKKKQAGA